MGSLLRHTVRPASVLLAVVLALAMSGPAPAQDVSARDLEEALNVAWRDGRQCSMESLCYVYFDTFGVAIMFSDGTIKPFAHLRRLSASAHDCIRKAMVLLKKGNRALAVQWVMASQPSQELREWMGDHPDAVIASLRACCSS